MQNNNEHIHVFAQEEGLNLRKVLLIAQKNWYLFVIFGLLGIAGGYIFSRYSQPTYQVYATINIPQNSSSLADGFGNLAGGGLWGSSSEINTQVEFLKSFSINKQVAQKLNWRTSWYKKDKLEWDNLLKVKDIFSWKAFYKDEPFRVQELEGKINISGVRIFIEPLSGTEYRLSIRESEVSGGDLPGLSTETVMSFGQVFENDYFHFRITPNSKPDEFLNKTYFFVFNKSTEIAQNYLSKIDAKVDDADFESNVIRLQIQGKQPQREIDYLNELISVYIQNKMNYQTETQKKSLQFIDKQLNGITDSLNIASTNFSQFKSKNQIVNISEQGNQVMQTLKEIESDKNKNQMQLEYFRNLLNYLKKSDDLQQLMAPSMVGIQDPTLNAMVVRASELYSRRQMIAISAKENNPTLLIIDKQIAQTIAQLLENVSNLVKNAEVVNNSLEAQQIKIRSQLNQLPEKEQDMINYQRRYELTSEVYTFLLQKRAEINISLAGTTPDVQIIDEACMETTSLVGTASRIKIAFGLILGLGLPAIFLLIVNFFSNTIQSQEDIEQNTKLPVLGNVIHSRTNSDTPVNDNPRSGIAESYRAIRTNLQFVLNNNERKIVAVHSTNPGEGKSFTSVNLATILAMNDKKVVLVGADMRKGRLHKIFGIENDHGLSTYLSDQDPINEVTFDTLIENLKIIPAGPIPPNPSELIDKPEMLALLEELANTYDYVIIDNAPSSIVTDGFLAGRHANLNIFILRYGVSKTDQLKYINQIADNKILNNLTLIINDIHGPGFGYGQNYYYNYKYANYADGYYHDEKKPKGLKKLFGRKHKKKEPTAKAS
jgi:capsular exopolysaccharide synthesis family protein